jgi:hypothetical protein
MPRKTCFSVSIDESGEDYLYPKSFFIGVELPQKVIDRIALTA